MQRQETSRSIKSEPRPKMASVALRWSDLIPPSRQPPIHTIYVSRDDRNHHLSDALSAAYLEARERSAASRRSCRTTASSWMKLIVSPPTWLLEPPWMVQSGRHVGLPSPAQHSRASRSVHAHAQVCTDSQPVIHVMHMEYMLGGDNTHICTAIPPHLRPQRMQYRTQ